MPLKKINVTMPLKKINVTMPLKKINVTMPLKKINSRIEVVRCHHGSDRRADALKFKAFLHAKEKIDNQDALVVERTQFFDPKLPLEIGNTKNRCSFTRCFMLSVGFDRMINGTHPKRKRILNLAKELSSWAYKIFESGPRWSRRRAAHIMNSANAFISNFDESIYDLRFKSPEEAHDEMRHQLFYRGHSFTVRTNQNLEEQGSRWRQVLSLSLDLGIQAPPGFHSIFKRSSTEYTKICGNE